MLSLLNAPFCYTFKNYYKYASLFGGPRPFFSSPQNFCWVRSYFLGQIKINTVLASSTVPTVICIGKMELLS